MRNLKDKQPNASSLSILSPGGLVRTCVHASLGRHLVIYIYIYIYIDEKWTKFFAGTKNELWDFVGMKNIF